MSALPRLAVIIASTRPERVGPTIAGWVLAGAQAHDDVDVDLIDLADHDLPNLAEPEPASSGNYVREETRAWSALISGYDGFIFVTPEYNRGIPGSLKNALDYLYAEWNDKAAGIVCYGSSGGLRAAEQLKTTLGELQVATVRAQVSVSIFDDLRDFTRLDLRDFQDRNLAEMVRQTARWAGALKTLRKE